MSANQASFLFLGTGASAGVPVIRCTCTTCHSSLAYNQRLRSSLLLQMHGKNILLDSGPDFRQQALHHQLNSINALLLTHTHYDHIAGIDDLRILAILQNRPIPTFLSQESLETLQIRYAYLYQHSPMHLLFQSLPEPQGTFSIDGIPFSYFHYLQGPMQITGYRSGEFAYVTDIRNYDPSIFAWLRGIRFLVVSALRKEPSHVHFSLEEAVQFAEKTGAEMSWITHISHNLEHQEASSLLPPYVQMGYDGLSIPFTPPNLHA